MRAKQIFNVVLVLAAVGAGVALSLRPWRVYQQQQTLADSYRVDAERAEVSRIDLERQKAKYDSPVGRETLARERGYRKANERDLDLGD